MYNIQYNKKRRIFIGIAVLILAICLLLIIHQLLTNKNKEVVEVADKEQTQDLQNFNKEEADFQIGVIADYITTDAKDLYQEADLVITGKYIKDNKSYVREPKSIGTESEMEVLSVIKGEYASNTININYYGGTILLAEYITCETEEGLKKKGWDQFTDEELKNMTISYEAGEVAVNFQPNKEYVIFLKYIEEKEGYFVFGDGYGARELSEDGKMYNLDTKTFDTKLTELN